MCQSRALNQKQSVTALPQFCQLKTDRMVLFTHSVALHSDHLACKNCLKELVHVPHGSL